MRRIFFITLLLFPLICASAQEKAGLFTGSYNAVPFSDFSLALENQTGVRIFFNPDWTSGIVVSGTWNNVPAIEAVNGAVSPAGLFCFEDSNGNIIITRGFAIRKGFAAEHQVAGQMMMADTVSPVKGKVTSGEVITFGNQAEKSKAGRVMLSGFVRNSSNGEPVPGASVILRELGTGVSTNQDGYYLITAPRGTYRVEYRSLGSVDTYRNVNLFAGGHIDVDLDERVIAIKDAVVTASRTEKLEGLESGMMRMNAMTIRLSPSSLGEADVIKSVLLMPGVQTTGEGSGGFNVRGGSADQNLILFYDAPLYNTSHFFGFFSAINSDVISDVSLYKGGIPASYGGRVSSIMDIGEKDGNKDKYTGNAGISMVAAHFTLEGPVRKEHSSFLVAGRTTYSNWIMGLLPNASLRNSRAGFWDINGHYVTDLGKKTMLELSTYYSHDDFRLNSDTTYAYDNLILSARMRHTISQSLFSVFSLTNSNYRYRVSSLSQPEYAYHMSHRINTTTGKANLTWYHSSGHTMNLGTEINLHLIAPGIQKPMSPASVVSNTAIDSETGLESALYADYEADLTNNLTARAGLRFSSFLALGPATVYTYNPGFPKEYSSLIDSVTYGPGSIIKTYAGPELRLSLNYRLSANSALKLNYNRTYQYLHLLSNTIAISPTDTWKMCDYHIKPQKGDQVAAGIFLDLAGNDYEITLDGYYKWLDNLIDYKGGASLTMNKVIEQDIIAAEGKAYGIEFTFKKNKGKLKSTLNYTWSRSFYRSKGQYESEIINSGEYYPSNYDRPHDFNLQLNYLYSRRINWNVNLVYTTGRPVTYPVTWYMHNGVPVIYYSDRNQYRLPDYFRCDVSMNMYSNLRASRKFRPSWTFAVYNLTGRENVYSVYFRNENGKVQGYKMSIFARAIPTVTYRIDF